MLFSKGAFISIFASDPHIIIKAINQNLNSVLRDSNINGHDYMRNIVHLPVFLNSRGLSSTRRTCMASTNGDTASAEGEDGNGDRTAVLTHTHAHIHTHVLHVSPGWHEELDRKLSQHSLAELSRFGSKTTLNRRVSSCSASLCATAWV